ncbi:enoyl-[acyl-carrier-protein] reductase [NADH] [Clostridia bacterium]|nr:enoyl-[acyl-carrier-protein] reductase [NADH] [Clostridia bacterium]
MIIQPKTKGFICTTAHPVGCKENVRRQIEYIRSLGKKTGAKNVLIIGASTGYGLASRISTAFGLGSATLGVMYEKESNGKRTATAGWYNTKAFEDFAHAQGLYAKSINGDAFSKEIKEKTIQTIREDLGTVDLVIYSLAAPKRVMEDGTVYQSTLRTIGKPFTEKSWDLEKDKLITATIEPASEEEIQGTKKVMGGEDWMLWIEALEKAKVLSHHAMTLAYSYIGPERTYPVYYQGTIGQAKEDLQETAKNIRKSFSSLDLQAYICVNKALVTQASSAIPIVPLYFALLYRVMKKKGLHEDCIGQMGRLFLDKLLPEKTLELDEESRIRMDDYEMRQDVQAEVDALWQQVNEDNLHELADTKGYWDDFYHLFGFFMPGIDYNQETEV